MTLELSCVDLTTLVRAFSAQFEIIAQQVGVHFRVSVDEGVLVAAHSEPLQRALLSLLVATIRYTPKQGTVALSLVKQQAQARLVLEAPLSVDSSLVTAPRRPLDHLESLLDGGVRQIDSGFAHVKAVLYEYSGQFDVLQRDGNISGFAITLPSLDESRQSSAAAEADVIGWGSLSDGETRRPSGPEDYIPCVIVLVSNTNLAAFIVGALSGSYRVFEASDRQTAIRQIEREKPDLVITERPLESICEAFKAYPMLAGTPVMSLITSEDDISEECNDAPVIEAFLRMPFTERIVRRRVSWLIRLHRSSNRRFQESEERYRMLFRYSPEAIVVSENEQVILVNQAALRLFRADHEDQLLGKSIYEIVDPHYHDVLRQRVQFVLQTHEPLPLFENRMLRVDGQPIDVEALSVPIELGGQTTIHSLLRDITERRQLERQVVDVATAEQVRIGAEIHDSIGQELTALDLLSYGVARQVRNQVPYDLLEERLDELRAHVQRALKTARMLAKGLSPAQIGSEGLAGELSRLAVDIKAASAIECTFTANGTPSNLDETAIAHLYRIAQEAVNNSVKHAHPDKIEIMLDVEPSKTRLLVVDDGVGLEASGLRGTGGLGLKIMRYRANVIGAKLSISSDESGTRIECELA